MADAQRLESEEGVNREDRNWFTSILDYSVRRETDEAAVGVSELEELTAAFRKERNQSLEDMVKNYPEITTVNVELLEKQIGDVYPQAHELCNVLKQKRHFLENSLVPEAEEYNKHLIELRENLAVVEATIEVFDKLKVVHNGFTDAHAALENKEFTKCADLLADADDKLLAFSAEEQKNILFLSDVKSKLRRVRSDLLKKLETTWHHLFRFDAQSSSDNVAVVFGDDASFASVSASANRLGLLDRFIRTTCQEFLNTVVLKLFDAEKPPVLNEDRIGDDNIQLRITFPAAAGLPDTLSGACVALEVLHNIIDRMLKYCLAQPTADADQNIVAVGNVLRKVISETLGVPLMQELVVEKSFQAFSSYRSDGLIQSAVVLSRPSATASKQRMQTAVTRLYELFVHYNVACGSAPDISMATNLIERNVLESACDEYVQRARRAVSDSILFRNGKTVTIATDREQPSLVEQMLATVQLAVATLPDNSAFSGIMPSNSRLTMKQNRRQAAGISAASTGELRMQASASLHELSVTVDDVLAACGQASSQDAINLYVRTIADIYDTYLALSEEMAADALSDASVLTLTFCSCAFYPQIIVELKSKIEEVLRWNEAVVLGNISNDQWSTTFDNICSELSSKALVLAESFARRALQQQASVSNEILFVNRSPGRSGAAQAAVAPGDASSAAAAKLMKAATWLKHQPAASVLSTAASSLAASAASSAGNTPEVRLLIDGACLTNVYEHLEALQTEWFAVMPPRVALAMLSGVVDIVLGKLGLIVFRQKDISADDATAMSQNFKLLARKLMLLYKSLLGGEAPTRHTTRWDWFNELAFVLEASMTDIDNRWSEGQGPLALHFGASQLMQLVRVLFENNDRRQRLLDKLEYAAAEENRS